MSLPLVLGITGASGAVYARRLLEVLLRDGREVHVAISPSGRSVISQELGLRLDGSPEDAARLLPADVAAEALRAGRLCCHRHDDYFTPIASGSFLTGGMVVCPCSGGTLSSIAHGASDNLIERAADVHLKERRKLILVPRETPLSIVHLDNMKRACEVGAVVLPAMPGWYHGVQTLQDLVDFLVARILDQLGLDNRLIRRWASEGTSGG